MRLVIPACLALSLLALGCSSEPSSTAASGGAEAAFPAEPLTTVETKQGGLSIEVRTAPQQPPKRGVTDVELVVLGADGEPVEGLDLAVQTWMPQMGHGASTKPSIEDMGGGHYVVSNVVFFMPGNWELRTSIAGAKNDSAILNFKID
jgi:YtkA-like